MIVVVFGIENVDLHRRSWRLAPPAVSYYPVKSAVVDGKTYSDAIC